jgi:hypothetical protein
VIMIVCDQVSSTVEWATQPRPPTMIGMAVIVLVMIATHSGEVVRTAPGAVSVARLKMVPTTHAGRTGESGSAHHRVGEGSKITTAVSADRRAA